MESGLSLPQITNLVRDAFEGNDAALFESAEQVESLTQQQGWNVLVTLLDRLRDDEVRRMTRQVLETRADYAVQTGRVWGLEATKLVAGAVIEVAVERREALAAVAREREAASV